MFPNESATLYKKTGVSNKKVQRKTAVQTKPPFKREKKESEDYSLIFRRKKSSKTQTKDS